MRTGIRERNRLAVGFGVFVDPAEAIVSASEWTA